MNMYLHGRVSTLPLSTVIILNNRHYTTGYAARIFVFFFFVLRADAKRWMQNDDDKWNYVYTTNSRIEYLSLPKSLRRREKKKFPSCRKTLRNEQRCRGLKREEKKGKKNASRRDDLSRLSRTNFAETRRRFDQLICACIICATVIISRELITV